MFCPGHQLNFTSVSATRLELVAPVVDLFGREQGYHPNSAVPDQSRPFFPIIELIRVQILARKGRYRITFSVSASNKDTFSRSSLTVTCSPTCNKCSPWIL